MADEAQLTAAPREITLGDKQYRMRPMADREIAEFVAWVQDREFALARRQAADMPVDERVALLDRVSQRTASYSVGHPRVLAAMGTIEGLAKALWLGLRHDNPEITVDDIIPALSDERTQKAALEDWDRINGGGADAGAKKKRPPKVRKPRRRASR